MSNDLSRGLFPADQVKLLVVDEAHRAQGDYAYCQVFIILLLRTKCFKFRLLKFVGRVAFLLPLTSQPIFFVHTSNKWITGIIVACTIEFASPRDNYLIYYKWISLFPPYWNCTFFSIFVILIVNENLLIGHFVSSSLKVIKELSKSNAVYRVVALSATPGSDLKAVRLVLQNLMVNNCLHNS